MLESLNTLIVGADKMIGLYTLFGMPGYLTYALISTIFPAILIIFARHEALKFLGLGAIPRVLSVFIIFIPPFLVSILVEGVKNKFANLGIDTSFSFKFFVFSLVFISLLVLFWFVVTAYCSYVREKGGVVIPAVRTIAGFFGRDAARLTLFIVSYVSFITFSVLFLVTTNSVWVYGQLRCEQIDPNAPEHVRISLAQAKVGETDNKVVAATNLAKGGRFFFVEPAPASSSEPGWDYVVFGTLGELKIFERDLEREQFGRVYDLQIAECGDLGRSLEQDPVRVPSAPEPQDPSGAELPAPPYAIAMTNEGTPFKDMELFTKEVGRFGCTKPTLKNYPLEYVLNSSVSRRNFLRLSHTYAQCIATNLVDQSRCLSGMDGNKEYCQCWSNVHASEFNKAIKLEKEAEEYFSVAGKAGNIGSFRYLADLEARLCLPCEATQNYRLEYQQLVERSNDFAAREEAVPDSLRNNLAIAANGAINTAEQCVRSKIDSVRNTLATEGNDVANISYEEKIAQDSGVSRFLISSVEFCNQVLASETLRKRYIDIGNMARSCKLLFKHYYSYSLESGAKLADYFSRNNDVSYYAWKIFVSNMTNICQKDLSQLDVETQFGEIYNCLNQPPFR